MSEQGLKEKIDMLKKALDALFKAEENFDYISSGEEYPESRFIELRSLEYFTDLLKAAVNECFLCGYRNAELEHIAAGSLFNAENERFTEFGLTLSVEEYEYYYNLLEEAISEIETGLHAAQDEYVENYPYGDEAYMGAPSQTVFCPKCHGEHSAELTECPFCGNVYTEDNTPVFNSGEIKPDDAQLFPF